MMNVRGTLALDAVSRVLLASIYEQRAASFKHMCHAQGSRQVVLRLLALETIRTKSPCRILGPTFGRVQLAEPNDDYSVYI